MRSLAVQSTMTTDRYRDSGCDRTLTNSTQDAVKLGPDSSRAEWQATQVRVMSISNWPCNLAGTQPLNWLSLRYSLLQAGEVAQLRRYFLANQLVVAEVQHTQPGEATQLRRYLSDQLVLPDV